MLSQRPITLALLVALLLPSCGPWHIGERIRYDSELHVGAALKHATVHYYPAEDAKLVAWKNAAPEHRGIGGDPQYVLAPEVTYRVRRPLVDGFWNGFGSEAEIVDLKPTGRMVLVRPSGRTRTERWHSELVATLPEGMVADPLKVPADKPFDYAYWRELGDFDTPSATRGSVGSQIAAAPFDYAIDPALSAVTLSPLLVPAAVVGGAVVVVGTPVWLVQRLLGDRDALPPWKYHYLLP